MLLLFGHCSILRVMLSRLRTLLALTCLLFALGAAPAFAQEEPAPGDAPAVVVDDGAAVPTEDAWTFRFLVPTVLGLSGLAIAATVIGYGVRIRSRYRGVL
mgnify:CR=1 FL=1